MLAAAQTSVVVLGQSGALADVCIGAGTCFSSSPELLLSVDGGFDDSASGLRAPVAPASIPSYIVSISAGKRTSKACCMLLITPSSESPWLSHHSCLTSKSSKAIETQPKLCFDGCLKSQLQQLLSHVSNI